MTGQAQQDSHLHERLWHSVGMFNFLGIFGENISISEIFEEKRDFVTPDENIS